MQLERETDKDVVIAYAPYYPKERLEGWWLVVGDTKSNNLASIKRLSSVKNMDDKPTEVKLDFKAPEMPGEYVYTLYLMCDSYTGCDQEYEVKFTVEGQVAMEEEEKQEE